MLHSKRSLNTLDGDTFDLELLVPPGSDPVIAGRSLDVLYDSIMWMYLFTGPEQYRQPEKRKEIMDMVKQRDLLKNEEGADGKKLEKIRDELKKAIASIKPGYKYTGTVYREIGMQNSQFRWNGKCWKYNHQHQSHNAVPSDDRYCF